MNIAMVHTPILGRSGGDRQVLTLAVELQKRGHNVEIFVSGLDAENSYPELLKKLKVTVIPHPLGKRMPMWLTPLENSKQKTFSSSSSLEGSPKSVLRNWMRRYMGRQFYTIPYDLPSMVNIGKKIPKGFDIINNHNYPSEWAAVYAKSRLKTPVVWMCNEPPFWFFVPELRLGLRRINWPVYGVLDRITAQYVDEFIVLSRIAAQHVKKAYGRTSTVIRSGVDVERFQNAKGNQTRKRLGLENNLVLLQVGNIELNKRQTDTIKALQILSRKYSHIRLIFDGGGRRDELIKYCKDLGVFDKVLFVRSNSDEDLADIYAACDVFVFPAQITWGLAAVEAMAAAKPVVISKACGASEIVEHNISGIIVNHGRPEEMAQQIELLINNPDLRHKLGLNALKYVKENLSWQKYAENMERVFKKVVETKH